MGTNLLQLDDAFSLQKPIKSIHSEILKGFHHARGPADFDFVNLCDAAQTEMNAEIALR